MCGLDIGFLFYSTIILLSVIIHTICKREFLFVLFVVFICQHLIVCLFLKIGQIFEFRSISQFSFHVPKKERKSAECNAGCLNLVTFQHDHLLISIVLLYTLYEYACMYVCVCVLLSVSCMDRDCKYFCHFFLLCSFFVLLNYAIRLFV